MSDIRDPLNKPEDIQPLEVYIKNQPQKEISVYDEMVAPEYAEELDVSLEEVDSFDG